MRPYRQVGTFAYEKFDFLFSKFDEKLVEVFKQERDNDLIFALERTLTSSWKINHRGFCRILERERTLFNNLVRGEKDKKGKIGMYFESGVKR